MKSNEKHAFALEDTLAVYGIRKNPFPIDETDEFFFSTPMLAKQMEVLKNLVEYGELLLVVSGVEGAGKTTFLEQFLLNADERWTFCRIDARQDMNLETLVDELLEGFGLSVRGDDAQASEELLRAHLAKLRDEARIALVAVDDAQALPLICSQFLRGLAEEQDPFELRLLFASEPGRLDFPTDDPKRVHVVVLQPFDLQHCGEYIHTRLSYAGLGGDSPFNAEVVAGIHQDSGGLPGTIHSLALHTLLANADTARLGRGPSKITRPMIYAAAAIVIAVAGAALLRPDSGGDALSSADSQTASALRGPIEGAAAGGAQADLKTPSTDQPDAASQPFTGSISPTALTQDPQAASQGALTEQGPSETKVFALNAGEPATRPAIAVQSPAAGKAEPLESAETEVRLAGNVSPGSAVAVKSQVKARTNIEANTEANAGLDWLRKQNPSDYVIQLVGTRDAAAAGKFLDEHHLGSKGAWFVTSHENKPWYVVVYGVYPDNAAARAAIKTLPEPVRAGSPWPRSVASVLQSAR
jgi:DamX protein